MWEKDKKKMKWLLAWTQQIKKSYGLIRVGSEHISWEPMLKSIISW